MSTQKIEGDLQTSPTQQPQDQSEEEPKDKPEQEVKVEPPIVSAGQNEDANVSQDDDLEEGEIKDDDDDDDDEDENDDETDRLTGNKSSVSEKSKHDSDSASESRSRKSSTSSSSPSSSSSSSSPSSSSTSSSSHRSPHSAKSRSIIGDRTPTKSSIDGDASSDAKRSSARSILTGSKNEKAAKLISMRSKLLEARSREIEMKFQKNRGKIVVPPSSTPSPTTISLITAPSQTVKNVKMTVTKPSIQYSENDPSTRAKRVEPSVFEYESRKTSRSKSSKKKRKKSSSSSSKKRKKLKTSSSSKKVSAVDSQSRATSVTEKSPAQDVVNESQPPPDHQGPRTPPDNQVLTLDDEQVEWPSYLIKMTITQPSISYSVNPDSVIDSKNTKKSDTADLNNDFDWYYDHFIRSLEMEHYQAQHQACTVMLSSGDYDQAALDQWLEQRGFIRQIQEEEDVDSKSNRNGESEEAAPTESEQKDPEEKETLPRPSTKPKVTVLKCLKEVILPNGRRLPPGTIQKIVHPFPRTERVAPDIMSTFMDIF